MLNLMKTKFVTLCCVLAIGLGGAMQARAMLDGSPEAVAADVIVARPAGLVATAVGCAFFVIALPFAAMTKSVKKTGRTLVGIPARATFQRPLGDFTDLTQRSQETGKVE